jgi:hypothetical protein
VGAYAGSIEAWYLDEESLKYGFSGENGRAGTTNLIVPTVL